MEINRKKKDIELRVPFKGGVAAYPKDMFMLSTTTLEKEPIAVNDVSSQEFKSPSHYAWFEEKFNIPSHKILEQFSFNIGNAMKYLIRHGRKKSMGKSDREKAIDDLKKAINFINFEIKRLSDNNG